MTWGKLTGYFGLGLLAFLSLDAARAQETVARSYPVPEHGTIEFKIPSSWKDQIQQLKGALPPTITWSQKSGAAFRILVAVGWQDQEADARLTEAELKQRVDQAMAARESPSENELRLQELKGLSARGYYFSATARAPKPGEHKYLTQGIVLVDELIVAFTIFTNDGQEGIAADALAAIRSATQRKK
ncbi:MAG: hypothetical protein HYX73_07825 [Acidobacteria bacterium]|nr:hypothetical protein [Acidobacteriota bacterium]